jgi:zinc/manganese transport system permease protein
MTLDSAALSIVGPALAAGLLVTATHVPFGIQVLKRGIVFIDLAVAQIAGLGVIVADRLGFEPQGAAVQVAALAAALGGALLLNWTDKRWPEVQEAVIGVTFIVAANAAILLLASNPHGAENLKDLLVGQILWADPARLAVVAVIYAAILATWFGFGASYGDARFYLLFAVGVTASVQLVGIYLVFASLIIPALGARRFAEGMRLWVGYSVGLAGYLLGLVCSSLFDLPTGAVIVVTLLVTFIGAVIISLLVPDKFKAA